MADSTSPSPKSFQGFPENAKKNKSRDARQKRSAPVPALPPQKLYEKLGHEMVDKLVQDFHIPQETPTLLDRLRDLGLISIKSSQPTTPRTSDSKAANPCPPDSQKNPANQSFATTGCEPLANQPRSIVTLPFTDSSSKVPISKSGHKSIFTLGDFAAGKTMVIS